MIRNLVQTLAAGVGLLLAVYCAGALVGVFLMGLCSVAPTGVCL